jgi:hypothetical protein
MGLILKKEIAWSASGLLSGEFSTSTSSGLGFYKKKIQKTTTF